MLSAYISQKIKKFLNKDDFKITPQYPDKSFVYVLNSVKYTFVL